MAIDVVIGGQRGDEGKGNFCAWLGLRGGINKEGFREDYSIAVRSASPQAGHSIYINDKRFGIAHLPCAVVNKNLRLLLGGASSISPKKIFYGGKELRPHTGEVIELEPEIPSFDLTPERLGIDYRAKLVLDEHGEKEKHDERLMKLGSIGSGVNMAKIDLIYKEAKFIKEDSELSRFSADTVKEMNLALSQGKHILFETDHGIELCQHFGGYFPYNTARTINTSAYLGEVGLPPQSVRDVYLVIKPYITAVAKDAPFKERITDKETLDELLEVGGESGSISGRIRKVGKFDEEGFEHSIMLSGATKICISHLDLSEHAWNTMGFSGEGEFFKKVRELSNKTFQKPKVALLCYGKCVNNVIDVDY